jgi:3-methylcrotonyl-CoA carboxylase alpha subunit
MNRDRARDFVLTRDGEAVTVRFGDGREGRKAEAGGVTFAAGHREGGGASGNVAAELDGRVVVGWVTVGRDRVTLVRDGRTLVLGLPDVTAPAADESDAGALLAAPMPGKVTRLLVATGERVALGQTLAILEAMKMEHRFEAPREGW